MKIGHSASSIREQAPPATAASGRMVQDDSTVQGHAAAAGNAKVELSSADAALIAADKVASAEIDSAKVARISQAIADGSFHVNAEAIADKLIANAQEVLASVKR